MDGYGVVTVTVPPEVVLPSDIFAGGMAREKRRGIGAMIAVKWGIEGEEGGCGEACGLLID